MAEMLTGDPAEAPAWLRAFAGAQQPQPEAVPQQPMPQAAQPQMGATPPIIQGMPGAVPQRDPEMDSVSRAMETLTNAYARVKSGQPTDRVTEILKARSAEKPSWDEIGQAISQGFGSISTTGDRKFIGVGEALNNIRANKILEAEKLARVQIADEATQAEQARALSADIINIMRHAEQVRHNREVEKKKSDFDKKIEALSEDLPPEIARGIAAGRYVVTKDLAGMPTGIVDIGTGRNVWQIGAPVPQGSDAAPPPTATPPTIEPAQATGASGFFGNIANTVTDLFGGKLAAPKVEEATRAFKSLRVQTETALRPTGHRPTNYLMQQFGELAVEPGSLFQGDERSAQKVRQIIGLLKSEINRIDRTVLGNRGAFKPDVLSEASANKSELQGLLREYEVVLKGFEGNIPTITGDEDFRKLPSGTRFRDPQGNIRRKP